MARFYFECEDEEMIKFLRSLKRKRSAIIIKLLYQLMDESDEYLPNWLIAETGCKAKVNQGERKVTRAIKETPKTKEVKEEETVKPAADVALAGLAGFGL